MAQDVNLTPGEVVRVNAPAGETLKVTGGTVGATTVTVGATDGSVVTPPPPTTGEGVLISKAELMSLPGSGAAWDRMVSASNAMLTPSLSDQDSSANVNTLACALVAARTGNSAKRAKTIDALKKLKGLPLDRALALGRELGAYVIASDVIAATDAEVGYDQKAMFLGLLTKTTSGGPSSLLACAKQRPNNWGTHAFGAIACVYSKYGTDAQRDELYKYVKGWLGDRSSYSGFTYGELSWQANSSTPVGINPKGALKSGKNIDGVLPDDLRRGGSFPTIGTDGISYSWEALQGALLAALVLERTGRPIASLRDEALYRAYRWLVDGGHAAAGDDTWQPHAFRKLYPAHAGSIKLPTSTSPGKNFGWTDWLYG
jgi:hypothetical protein